jgi:hypothetical protein
MAYTKGYQWAKVCLDINGDIYIDVFEYRYSEVVEVDRLKFYLSPTMLSSCKFRNEARAKQYYKLFQPSPRILQYRS